MHSHAGKPGMPRGAKLDGRFYLQWICRLVGGSNPAGGDRNPGNLASLKPGRNRLSYARCVYGLRPCLLLRKWLLLDETPGEITLRIAYNKEKPKFVLFSVQPY